MQKCSNSSFLHDCSLLSTTHFAVAAQVMSRGHTFKKATLQLQFVRQVKQEAEFQLNQLTIHGLPDGVEKDIYEVIIAGCLDMEEDDDFKMQISGSSAVITFAKDYSAEGTYMHSTTVHMKN